MIILKLSTPESRVIRGIKFVSGIAKVSDIDDKALSMLSRYYGVTKTEPVVSNNTSTPEIKPTVKTPVGSTKSNKKETK